MRDMRLKIGLGTFAVLLLVFSAFIFWSYISLKLHVEFASDQTQIFSEMRTRALSADPAEAADCLAYVVNYYPSGSKQVVGSKLDTIVERERALAIHDIIAYLNAKTGENLGEAPDAWIQKYGDKH
jgi:hypothetical protein